jgi:hypothetical protein
MAGREHAEQRHEAHRLLREQEGRNDTEETQGLAISSRLSGHRSCPAKCQVRCSPAELRSDFRE